MENKGSITSLILYSILGVLCLVVFLGLNANFLWLVFGVLFLAQGFVTFFPFRDNLHIDVRFRLIKSYSVFMVTILGLSTISLFLSLILGEISVAKYSASVIVIYAIIGYTTRKQIKSRLKETYS